MVRTSTPLLTTALVSTLLLGCAPDRGSLDDATLYAVGDSILEWNLEAGASIPQVVGQELGVEVYNAAIGGTKVLGGPESIPEQYVAGAWDWVLLDGGGNDTNDDCACGDCDAILDAILSEDGRAGAMAELAQRAVDDGAQAMVLGYYELPETAAYGFERCGEELLTLSSRQALLAESVDGVWFTDGREAVQADKPELYDDDDVHPSEAGSAAVGRLIAENIRAIEAR